MNGDGPGIGNRVIIIASVIFILIIGAIFFVITGGSRKTETFQPSATDLRVGRSVRMSVSGPIVGNESYTGYKITISQDQRTITRTTGYLETIVEERTYDNNRQAYEQFVYALDRANMTTERKLNTQAADERGTCPNGRRYAFEVLENDDSILRLWTTSCDKSKGSLNASASTLRTLFDKQIPETSQVLKGAKL